MNIKEKLDAIKQGIEKKLDVIVTVKVRDIDSVEFNVKGTRIKGGEWDYYHRFLTDNIKRYPSEVITKSIITIIEEAFLTETIRKIR